MSSNGYRSAHELDLHVATGGSFEDVVYGENSLTVRSEPQVRSFLSLVHVMPLTTFSCAWPCHTSSLLDRFHTLTTGSTISISSLFVLCVSTHRRRRCHWQNVREIQDLWLTYRPRRHARFPDRQERVQQTFFRVL